jgi:hypothetical protein
MGHAWLGFSEEHTSRLLGDAGFESIRIVALPADAKTKGPALFVATAEKQPLPRARRTPSASSGQAPAVSEVEP